MIKELVKDSVYECPHCNTLSKDYDVVKKCISKHQKKSLAEEKSKIISSFIEERFTNVFYKNLVELDSSIKISKFISIENAIKASISAVGFNVLDLNVNYRKGIKESINMYSERIPDSIKFGVSGHIEYVGINIEKMLKDSNLPISKKNFCDFLEKNRNYSRYYSLSKIIALGKESKVYCTPHDFFGLQKNVTIYSANGNVNGNGNGKNIHFSMTVEINISNDIDLLKEMSMFKEMLKANSRYRAETARLSIEYHKNNVPALKISDMEYLALKLKHEDIASKIEELKNIDLSIVKQMQEREAYLIENDPDSLIKPGEEFNFDRSILEKYNLLLNGDQTQM
jgi:hypothetical protein